MEEGPESQGSLAEAYQTSCRCSEDSEPYESTPCFDLISLAVLRESLWAWGKHLFSVARQLEFAVHYYNNPPK